MRLVKNALEVAAKITLAERHALAVTEADRYQCLRDSLVLDRAVQLVLGKGRLSKIPVKNVMERDLHPLQDLLQLEIKDFHLYQK